MTAASSTFASSFGVAATQFAAACENAAGDATALFRVVYGLDDGKDYGRFFYGQNPLINFVDAATSLAGLIAQGVAEQQAVSAAAAALTADDTDPATFGPNAVALTEAVRCACANPADGVRLLVDLCGFIARITTGGVADDPIGAQLFLLAVRAATRLRIAAAGSLVRASAVYQPTSREDAASVSSEVAAVLDGLALFCADIFDDATASALYAARVAVITDLQARGGPLGSVRRAKFNAALPALVIAYRLYGDATRYGDILARNPVPHPGFMPLEIEALTE